MSQRHLSEDQLIEACLGVPGTATHQHLLTCPACEARCATVGHLLAEVNDVATAQSDAVFSPARLARQQAKILERVDQDGRPARVIAFPAGQAPAPPMHARPATRLVAGAAAAGLVLGLVGGHFAHELPTFSGPTAQAVITQSAAAAPMRTAIGPDDEFLAQVELAVGSAGPAVLRPIDVLTPKVSDVR